MLDKWRADRAWRRKQQAAEPGRFYGDGGTIHSTGWIDVETRAGSVVAVWFRCMPLPFLQTEVDAAREIGMLGMYEGGPDRSITGVTYEDAA